MKNHKTSKIIHDFVEMNTHWKRLEIRVGKGMRKKNMTMADPDRKSRYLQMMELLQLHKLSCVWIGI